MSKKVSPHAYSMRCSRLRKQVAMWQEFEAEADKSSTWWQEYGNGMARMFKESEATNDILRQERDKFKKLFNQWSYAANERKAELEKAQAGRDRWAKTARTLDGQIIRKMEEVREEKQREIDGLKNQLREMTEMRDAANRISAEARQQVTQLGEQVALLRTERDSARNELAENESDVLNLREEIRQMVASEKPKRPDWQEFFIVAGMAGFTVAGIWWIVFVGGKLWQAWR